MPCVTDATAREHIASTRCNLPACEHLDGEQLVDAQLGGRHADDVAVLAGNRCAGWNEDGAERSNA